MPRRGGAALLDRSPGRCWPGLIAAVALALSAPAASSVSNALGYSEGLATALDADRASSATSTASRARRSWSASWPRWTGPEIWLFWGPYGLWLFWRTRRARARDRRCSCSSRCSGSLPEYWGSGHFCAASAARRHPRSNSPRSPSARSVPSSSDAGLADDAAADQDVAAIAVSSRWRDAVARPARGLGAGAWDRRAGAVAAASAVLGARVVRDHRDHDPGRFLGQQPLPGARVGVDRHRGGGRHSAGRRAGSRAGLTGLRLGAGLGRVGRGRRVLALAFVILPNWVGNNLIRVPRTHAALAYQAHLRKERSYAVSKLGGTAGCSPAAR